MKPTYVTISVFYRDYYDEFVNVSASKDLRTERDLVFIKNVTDPRDFLKDVFEDIQISLDELNVSIGEPVPLEVMLKIVEIMNTPIEEFDIEDIPPKRNNFFLNGTIPLRVHDNGRWYDAKGEVSIHLEEDDANNEDYE